MVFVGVWCGPMDWSRTMKKGKRTKRWYLRFNTDIFFFFFFFLVAGERLDPSLVGGEGL